MSLKNALEKFDIDDPKISNDILDAALTSGDYPYEEKDEVGEIRRTTFSTSS